MDPEIAQFLRFLDPEFFCPFIQFLDPETTPFIQFLDPEFFCPFLQFLDPGTAVFLQFLDPETAPFLQFLGALWIVGGCLPSPCGGRYGSWGISD